MSTSNVRKLPVPKREPALVDADVLIGKMVHQDLTAWGQTLGMRPAQLPRCIESEWLVLGALYASQIGAEDVEGLEHGDFYSRHGRCGTA